MHGDRLRQRRRRRDVKVKHIGEQGGQIRQGQATQPDVFRRDVKVPPPGQQVPQRLRTVHFVITVGADQQQAVNLRPREYRVDETERGTAGPLKIVDDDDQRSCRRGDGTHQVDGHPLQPTLCLKWIVDRRLGGHVEENRELGQDRGKQPGVGAEGSQNVWPKLVELLLRLGQQEPAELPGGLPDRVKVLIPTILVELAGHEPSSAVRDDGPQFFDERRLSDAGGSADHHSAAPARQRLHERRREPGDLGLPANEPRRRRQAERESRGFRVGGPGPAVPPRWPQPTR